MKKLLILMLVLGVTSTANAWLQISVGGNPDPVDSQITIQPSQHLVLDIWTNVNIGPSLNETDWALVCTTSLGSIKGGVIVEPYRSDTSLTITIGDDAVNNGLMPVPEGTNGVWGGIYSFGTVIQAGSKIYDEIDFHCEALGDVTLLLYRINPDWSLGQLMDSVVIHQVIPEPATMLLLGLGGLFLRRRK